jgi:hypothetical protein
MVYQVFQIILWCMPAFDFSLIPIADLVKGLFGLQRKLKVKFGDDARPHGVKDHRVLPIALINKSNQAVWIMSYGIKLPEREAQALPFPQLAQRIPFAGKDAEQDAEIEYPAAHRFGPESFGVKVEAQRRHDAEIPVDWIWRRLEEWNYPREVKPRPRVYYELESDHVAASKPFDPDSFT